MCLTILDKQLLDLLQNNFPIIARPFSCIAQSFKITEQEVIDRIQKMKAEGIIRRIGPVFDAKSLGYTSSLFALKVPESQEEKAANYISTLKGVTHNYKRENEFNIWFTLVAESKQSLEKIIDDIKKEILPEKLLRLNSKKVFKLKGVFNAI
ncbi:MAG: Lrp/AsnC family transcriptional regulator [Candidatus Omnitrophota bacterium]